MMIRRLAYDDRRLRDLPGEPLLATMIESAARCCGMGLVGLAAAWPLGLGAEVRAALHPDRARQKAKKA